MAWTGGSARLLAFVLLVGVFFGVGEVRAATISVEATCSLNDAIRSANQNESVGDCRAGDVDGIDYIVVSGTFELQENPVAVTSNVYLIGTSSAVLDGLGRYRFFHVGAGGELSLQNVTMTKGRGSSSRGQIYLASGSSLSLSDSPITECVGTSSIVGSADASLTADSDSTVCGAEAQIVAPRNAKASKRKSSKDSDNIQNFRKPVIYTCEKLPSSIVVKAVAGTRSGIQCQVIDAAGVGRQDLIDAGIIVAVDIWGYVDPGVEVCLPGLGELVFLDAAFSPRQASWAAAYQQGNTTCARLTSAGSLVLLSSIPDGMEPRQVALDCQVRTLAVLNFR